MRFFAREQIDRAFDARTVAVIGANRRQGYSWLHRFDRFPGQVYSVHTNPESATEIEAMGIPNFESIKDVPGPVDYVVINTPRRTAVSLFRECVEAGVGAVSYYTSGFAETDAEGLAIQEQLAAISLESHVPLFGPNCLGIYNPARGMFSSSGEMPFGTSGPVGVVSQSGTHGGHFVRALDAWYGVRVAR